MNQEEFTNKIKAEALNLGFSACGVARAEAVDPEAARNLNEWLDKGYNGTMDYLARYGDKRCDPRLIVPGAKSIISVALNYYPQQKLGDDQLQFAYYAYGKDYHEVVKAKLNELLSLITNVEPTVQGRAFCDTAPILERYWAWKSGLGWIGNNTLLIIPNAGSFFFLGEIIVDLELVYDRPMKNHCGRCKRCVEACPAHALFAPGKMNAEKCLSYQTIENRGDISTDAKQTMHRTIYGCDECQKACPWNKRFATPNNTPELQPNNEFINMTEADWQQLTVERYRRIFKGSAVKRAKFEGLKRNIDAVEDNKTSNQLNV